MGEIGRGDAIVLVLVVVLVLDSGGDPDHIAG